MPDPMTAQEFFDKTVRHLLTQNKRAVNDDGNLCQYRAFDGLKCAIGCHIPDDLYDQVIEGVDAKATLLGFGSEARHAKLREIFKEIGIRKSLADLVNSLQTTHDSTPPTDWANALRATAECYNLSTTVIDEMTAISTK